MLEKERRYPKGARVVTVKAMFWGTTSLSCLRMLWLDSQLRETPIDTPRDTCYDTVVIRLHQPDRRLLCNLLCIISQERYSLKRGFSVGVGGEGVSRR
jgi:hypothetical protein